jgi:hypothetical protein
MRLSSLSPISTRPAVQAPVDATLPASQLRSGKINLKQIGKELAIGAILGNLGAQAYQAIDTPIIKPNLPPLEEVIPALRIPDKLSTQGNVAILEEVYRGTQHPQKVKQAVESLPFENGVEFHSKHKIGFVLKDLQLSTILASRPTNLAILAKGLDRINPTQTEANAVNISMGGDWLTPQTVLIELFKEAPLAQNLVQQNPSLFDIDPRTSTAKINPQKVFHASQGYIEENQPELRDVQQQLAQKVAELKKHNIPVFISSGNEAGEREAYQALLKGEAIPEAMSKNLLHVPGVISVGASKLDGTLTDYSTHYNGVRYTAPMPYEWRLPKNAEKLEGTSFSSPQVAAAAAYLIDEKGYSINEALDTLDKVGKPMVASVNGVKHPYVFLPFNPKMMEALQNAPRKMACDVSEAPE